MNAELVKRQDRWDLYGEDGSKLASSAPNPIGKLSLKNCEAIENGYDLDELVKSTVNQNIKRSMEDLRLRPEYTKYAKAGFQKALEINGDKKFSINDMEKLMFATLEFTDTQEEGETYPFFKSFIQSLQQTEWDCIIFVDEKTNQPLLDNEGNLILKRK